MLINIGIILYQQHRLYYVIFLNNSLYAADNSENDITFIANQPNNVLLMSTVTIVEFYFMEGLRVWYS